MTRFVQLKSRVLEKILKEQTKLQKMSAYVGIQNQEVASYAVYTEYGTSNMPQRSFLRVPTVKNRNKILKDAGAQLRKNLSEGKGISSKESLNILGVSAESVVLGSFAENDWPANAPSTIRIKGKDQPNVDTGRMRDSIKSWIGKS